MVHYDVTIDGVKTKVTNLRGVKKLIRGQASWQAVKWIGGDCSVVPSDKYHEYRRGSVDPRYPSLSAAVTFAKQIEKASSK